MSNSFKLSSSFSPSTDQENSITNIVNNLSNNIDRQVLLGVTGSGKTFVMANVIARTGRPTLILSHNKTLAAQLYEEFKEFFPENAVKYFVSYYDYYQPEAYLPGRDIYIEKESQINQEIEKLRFSAMNAAITRKDTIIIASVSCIYNIGSPENYSNKALVLKVGDNIPLSKLSRELSFMRYTRSANDFISGMYRVKGDLIDIFTPYSEYPIRIQLFGDTIEEIYYIDPLTSRRINKIESIEIYPSTSLVYEKEVLDTAIIKIEKDLKNRVEFLTSIGKHLEADRLKQKTEYDIEMLREVGYCKSMENYSIYFDGRDPGQPPYTLLDYFPKDYLLFIDESHITIPQIGGMFNGDKARKENLVDYGFRLPSAKDNRPLKFEEFQKKQGSTIYVSATPDQWELDDSNHIVTELLTRPTGLLDPEIIIKKSENQIDDVILEVKKNIEKGQRVLITTLTKRMAEDLTSYLKDIDIKVQYLHSDIDTVERVDILRDLRLGEYDVLVGINLLREGIDLPEVSLVIILDADKEGFLRSKKSLIQTIGRAARHVEGRVIMYADTLTDSIKYAIEETKRRREYQIEYNRINNIEPKTIVKEIRSRLVEKVIDEDDLGIDDERLKNKDIKTLIDTLEQEMFNAASNLQFEKAAKLRDKIKELKSNL